MSNTVDVFNEDGVLGSIPAENLQAALRDGYRQAIKVTSPEGVEGSIPVENLASALKDGGFKLGHAGVPVPAGLQGPPRATPTPVNPDTNAVLGAAKAVGQVGATAAKSYMGLLQGTLTGISGAVNDLIDPNQ
jgi:hypothetical protein